MLKFLPRNLNTTQVIGELVHEQKFYRGDAGVKQRHCAPDEKLQEVPAVAFADGICHRWAVVVHSSHTVAHLSTVMRSGLSYLLADMAVVVAGRLRYFSS